MHSTLKECWNYLQCQGFVEHVICVKEINNKWYGLIRNNADELDVVCVGYCHIPDESIVKEMYEYASIPYLNET